MHAGAMQGIGWQTIGSPGEQIFLKKLGPVATSKYQRPKIIDLERLRHFRKKYRTLGLYIEPGLGTQILGNPNKLGHVVEPFAQSKTSLVDLELSQGLLLKSFHQKTRYNINLTLKKKLIEIKSAPLSKLSTSSLDDFYGLRESWSKRKHVYGYEYSFISSIIKNYAGSGSLHIAYISNVPHSTLLVLENDRVATYYLAFSTIQGYKHFAPTLLTWTSMLYAQNTCDIYDFGGIYDPRYPRMYKKWQGFTKFKDGFHPTYVEYPQTHLQLFW